jgi:hypothetical protein
MANDITTERTAETDAEFAQRFAALVAMWTEGTRHRSRIKDFIEHPAFGEIVAMGERAVPLLLARIEKKENMFFHLALEKITGARPVPQKGESWIDELDAAWIAWGRAQGYRWEHVV